MARRRLVVVDGLGCRRCGEGSNEEDPSDGEDSDGSVQQRGCRRRRTKAVTSAEGGGGGTLSDGNVDLEVE